jgi:hypothetical protein
VGEPPEQVVSVAREIDADLMALGWAQTLAAGRAGVVRAALEQAKLPVLLIPVFTVGDERAEAVGVRLPSPAAGPAAAPGLSDGGGLQS